MARTPDFPVHDKLTVHDGETIYRTDEWWKAAVLYSVGDASPAPAIYLWQRDDDGSWIRKQKYRVKTADAWATDKQQIDRLLDASGDGDVPDDLPVSDYYEVGTSETIFKDENWWKAAVLVEQKGDYETREVMIYLWQQRDDDWKRRQKFTIKSRNKWETDRKAIDALFGEEATAGTPSRDPATAGNGQDELSAIENELEQLQTR